MLRYANPANFLALAKVLIPLFGVLAAALMGVALWQVFTTVPPDYQQGETVKIMYIHVPSAWLAMACYAMMSISAIGTLVWRHPLADVAQKAAAPIGAAFTLLCLLTGSLWGKPMWGTWWVWDARLTSVLVLFLIYCGIMALWNAIEDPSTAGRAVAIMTLVGAVNLPIIKFSVDWWSTLHQPAAVIRMDGPTIDRSMLWPLLIMAIGATFLFLTVHMAFMRNEILRRRVRRLGLLAAQRGDAPESDRQTAPSIAR